MSDSPVAEVPLSALVIDDELPGRSLVKSLVEADADLRLVGECEDGATALAEIARLKPDIVFADIRMPGLDGVRLAERLAQSTFRPHVVFVTAHAEHAVDAFELDALDYLLKPVEKDRFAVTVGRAKDAVRRSRATRPAALVVRRGDELVRLSESDIVWLEAAGQYSRIHTKDDCFMVSRPLCASYRQLPSGSFVRVHRSAVINRGKLVRILRRPNGRHLLELDNGDRVPLSRSRRALVTELLDACAAR